ncbi:hypothetical protein H3J60_004533 [Salmonella enterica]|nr:hypothetical protein [Salmonella enterica]
MTETEKILEALAFDLNEGKLKSKQTAFVKHHDGLLRVREYFSLQQISEILKSKYDIDLKPQVISNMMTRVRKKTGESKHSETVSGKSGDRSLRKNTNKGIFDKTNGKPTSAEDLLDPTAGLKKFEDKYK